MNARVTSPIEGPAEEARRVRDPGVNAPDADWNSERRRTAAVHGQIDLPMHNRQNRQDRPDADRTRTTGRQTRRGARGQDLLRCRALCGRTTNRTEPTGLDANRTEEQNRTD